MYLFLDSYFKWAPDRRNNFVYKFKKYILITKNIISEKNMKQPRISTYVLFILWFIKI